MTPPIDILEIATKLCYQAADRVGASTGLVYKTDKDALMNATEDLDSARVVIADLQECEGAVS